MQHKHIKDETVVPAHGIKAVRQLRDDANGAGKNRNPSVQKKIDVTYEYFTKEVDPLVSECITSLLCKQPENVIDGMLSHFKGRLGLASSVEINSEDEDYETRNGGKSTQRLYLATKISPILTKLINRVARTRPPNVLEFLCAELEQMKLDEPYSVPLPDDEAPESSENLASDTGIATEPQNINKSIPTMPTETIPQKPSESVGAKLIDSDVILPVGATLSNPVILEEPTDYKIQYTVIGNASSGKSSFLNCIQGKPDARVKPTTGFSAVKMALGDNLAITFYDQGGSIKIRSVWEQYYHDAHGIVFVVDATNTDPINCEETVSLFEKAVGHRCLAGKPILILSNKHDDNGNKLSIEKVSSLFHISRFSNCKVFECACVNMNPDPEAELSTDPRLDLALEWLINATKKDYARINQRVLTDTERKNKEDEHKRALKDRNVLKKKIASALHQIIDPSLMPEDVTFSENDVYDRDEGIKFLEGEIGIELTAEETAGKLIAAAVGYQRLALQMIGGMYNPPNKQKKKPMSWEEIQKIVESIRLELGLPAVPESF